MVHHPRSDAPPAIRKARCDKRGDLGLPPCGREGKEKMCEVGYTSCVNPTEFIWASQCLNGQDGLHKEKSNNIHSHNCGHGRYRTVERQLPTKIVVAL